jgi:hypothetical protein
MNNKDSICTNFKNVNMYNNIDRIDSDDDMMDDKRAVSLANSLKKLGNMSC